MKRGFRASMAWLHTWSGLLAGWVLFLVFLSGTASYFRPEISHWMRPEQHAAARAWRAAVDDPARAPAQAMVDHLARAAPVGFTLILPSAREPVGTAYWRDPTAGRRGFRQAVLDPVSGAPLAARDTRGGEFFFRLHFQLHHVHPIWGRWIVGLCAMLMLVAILSGIVTHRRIFSDFFTFRPNKGARSWMDAHAATAVLALPYHLMITYTGLATLMLMLMPWGTRAAYPGDERAFSTAVFGPADPGRPSGRPAPLRPVDPLLREASRLWDGAPPARIIVSHPGDAAARVEVLRGPEGRLSVARDAVLFGGASGEVLGREWRQGAASRTFGVMYGLHLGRFAEPLLRALFFISALAGTAMVGTGLVLWARKAREAELRAAGRAGFGTRAVEVLNLATLAGLPAAMAGFFWLNRLLPAAMPGRSDWEVDGFFILWGLCLAHAAARRGARRGWVEQFALGGALGLGLPVLNALTTASHLGATLPAGDWMLAGFDLALAGLGAALLGAALRLRRPSPPPRRAVPATVPAPVPVPVPAPVTMPAPGG